MGFRGRPLSGFAAPAIGIVATSAALGWLTRYPGFYADKLLLLLGVAALVGVLWRRTQRTNLLTARFVSALEHRDYARNLRMSGLGAGLGELGEAFDGAMSRLRAERAVSAAENRFVGALVDEAPTPLLAIDGEGRVHLANKAARRLFRESDGRPVDAFMRYGGELVAALADATPGERRTCRVRWNGLPQRALLAVAGADRQGEVWRIVSIQIIQTELDAAEMAVQADLVRVLTHEIMNSLTPVTSLATSASRLLDGAADDAAALDDARDAVATLARRAAAITDFVRAYRDFSETPSVTLASFPAADWLADIVRLFRATPVAAGVEVDLRLPNEGLRIDGDANLLGQVMLNLLRNAGQACRDGAAPQVRVEALSNDAGHTMLRVSDNGPGIATGLEGEVFLPFFTTKPDGSGVGLSFAKQIVLLHGGAIGLAPSELGGATFQIVL